MTRALVALIVVATAAHADEQAFRAAGELAAKNDPRALEAYEAAGAARPISRWSDDAWVEAARLAERQNDYARARRDLEHALAISDDAQLVRRAKRDLERIIQLGDWSAVAAEHQRLVTAIGKGGDPTDELEALEALARAHPQYPRGVALRVTIGRGWEEEGDGERGLGWVREAVRLDRGARPELVRMLIRQRELDAARRELALVEDGGMQRTLARKLASAEAQRIFRYAVGAALLALFGVALALMRRRTGSWRAVARRAIKPPLEVVYFAPIAIVVGLFATTGNPLVAKAVISIFAGAAIVGWISGVTLETARPVSRRHVLAHASVVAVAMLGAVYLGIDHARIVDLVLETWRTGPSSH